MLNLRIVSVFVFWGLLIGWLDTPATGVGIAGGALYYVAICGKPLWVEQMLGYPLWHPLRFLPITVLLGAPVLIILVSDQIAFATDSNPLRVLWSLPLTIGFCATLRWALLPLSLAPATSAYGSANGSLRPRPMSQPSRQRRQGD